MSYADIVAAIDNILKANIPLQKQFIILNTWR